MAEIDSELVLLNEEEQFLKNYRAVYNAMTAKPDCRSKAFPRDVIIEFSDICDLNERIFDKFKTYNLFGFSVNIIVSIKDRQKLEFPNWKSFEEHKWVETEIITGIVLIWEFNIKLPQIALPLKHTLMVKLSNGIRPEEMLGLIISGKLDQYEEIEQGTCPVVARMDFVDPGIGNEVLELVAKWVKGLKCSDLELGKVTIFLKRNKHKFAYILNYFTSFVALLCSIIILNRFLLSLSIETVGELKTKQVCEFINLIFICGISCFIINKISELISNAIFKILIEYGNEHTFNITKGDKNQQDKFRKAEKKDREKIIGNIVASAIINVLCGIITYFLTKGM